MEQLPKFIYYDDKDRAGRKNTKPYRGQFTYKNTQYFCGQHETIKQAQRAVDIKRLSLGLSPLYLVAKK